MARKVTAQVSSVQVEENGWEVFGQIVAFIGGISLAIFVLYLLLIAPYERYNRTMDKLSALEYQIDQYKQSNYYLLKEQGGK